MLTGFIRVAAATPRIRVADCEYNAGQIISLIKKAENENIRLICMPELCITGSTCGDLFFNKELIKNAKNALLDIVAKTADCNVLAVVGLPLELDGKLYNVAAVFCGGEIYHFTPKKYIPNYNEFNELRYFTPMDDYDTWLFFDNGSSRPFRRDLVIKTDDLMEFKFAVEIGEFISGGSDDATIIANISAISEKAGKSEIRRSYFAAQSSRLLCGYIYVNAGYGESTTDSVYSAHNIICENGEILAEAPPFGDGWVVSDIDLNAIHHDRKRINTFTISTGIRGDYYTLPSLEKKRGDFNLRKITPSPFKANAEEILQIQTFGLVKRLEHTGTNAVLGISGGLDSTLALLVTVRAYEKLGLDKEKIVAVTMPCFGTTGRTKSNAHKLCEVLGVPCREINITESVRLHLRDINHPEETRDITYENAQARIRTLVLMDLANKENGIVIGSGNLSELALGWATYNGDHMSMYSVNSGVPKTVVREVVKHVAETSEKPGLSDVLKNILATPVSPELLPPKDGEIIQQTEDIVGPYELHDFFIYHTLRWGREKTQVFELACVAFENKFPPDEIKKWLDVFTRRFYSQQFKRSCLPDGPQVFEISLSPRSGFRMPSDVSFPIKGE